MWLFFRCSHAYTGDRPKKIRRGKPECIWVYIIYFVPNKKHSARVPSSRGFENSSDMYARTQFLGHQTVSNNKLQNTYKRPCTSSSGHERWKRRHEKSESSSPRVEMKYLVINMRRPPMTRTTVSHVFCTAHIYTCVRLLRGRLFDFSFSLCNSIYK